MGNGLLSSSVPSVWLILFQDEVLSPKSQKNISYVNILFALSINFSDFSHLSVVVQLN